MPGPDLTNMTRYSDKIQTWKSRIYGGYRDNVLPNQGSRKTL